MGTVDLPLGGAFALSTIGQISVNARDLARAVAFYRDILRLPFLSEAANLAFFDAGGVRLMLAMAEQPQLDRSSSVLYFCVPEIRAGYQALVERGVRFVEGPRLIARLEHGEVWMAFFRDTEGNLLALMSEPPRPPASTPPAPDPPAS
ncbi:MAG: VOC family protein [Terriglobales bacterium]